VRMKLPSKAWEWILTASILGVFGFMALLAIGGIAYTQWTSRAYGEIPIPGSQRLHLPAGDVVVSLHSEVPNSRTPVPIPQGLELVITAPSGVPQPRAIEKLDDRYTSQGMPWDAIDAYRTLKVVHISVDGDYNITTNASANESANPRLSFGYQIPFHLMALSLLGLSGFGLLVATPIAYGLRARKEAADGPAAADTALLASGERARGVLKSFAKAKAPAQKQGDTPSPPELPDAPYYALQVELWLPNRMPVVGKNLQQAPLTEVPKLAIGRELTCYVDPADRTRFIVDWSV
jgi:hypothetical protein